MDRDDKKALIKTSFVLDLDDNGVKALTFLSEHEPEDFVDKVSNENAEMIWGKLPAWINENLGWDNGIEDESDGYRWDFDEGTVTYIGSLTYYFDKNQWMFLDDDYRPDPNHGHPYECESLRAELIVEFGNVFDEPEVNSSYISFDIDGNSEEFQLYPKCEMPQYMDKVRIKDFLCLEDEEDEEDEDEND